MNERGGRKDLLQLDTFSYSLAPKTLAQCNSCENNEERRKTIFVTFLRT